MYFIILYNERIGTVSEIINFGDDADGAFAALDSLETEHVGDATISVNLVTAKDQRDLRSTWKRFFREIYVDWDWASRMSGPKA